MFDNSPARSIQLKTLEEEDEIEESKQININSPPSLQINTQTASVSTREKRESYKTETMTQKRKI